LRHALTVVVDLIGLRAAGLPATDNGYWDRKAAAKPVSRTVVTAVRAAISAAAISAAAISATAMAATTAMATVAATMAATVPAAVASAAVGSESGSRNEGAAQHEGNGEGNSCFAKHVSISLNMAGAE